MEKKFIEEYIEVNGIKEYTYQVIEEGLPIAIFVHGSGTPDSLFAYKQVEAYKGICSCIFYDQRGAGKTYVANKKMKPHYEAMQQDLLETIQFFCRKYQKKKVIIVANSLGTVLATPVVQQHSELIAAFVVSGFLVGMRLGEAASFPELKARIQKEKGETGSKKVLAGLEQYPREQFDDRAEKEIMKVRRLQQTYHMSNPVTKEMKQMLMNSPIFHYSDLFAMLTSAKKNKQLFSEIWGLDAREGSVDFRVPIYFLHGANDYIAPMGLAKEYFELLTAPKKEFVVISNAGHMTGFDNQEEYNSNFIRIVGTLNNG